MKATVTIVLVLFFGTIALAQKKQSYDTLEFSKMDFVLDSRIDRFGNSSKTEVAPQKEITRLYKYRNSRVLKALSFQYGKEPEKLA